MLSIYRFVIFQKMYQPVKQALSAIGDANTYQKLLIAFLFLILTQVNFMLIGPTFIFMNPLFNCSFTDELVDQSIACDRLQQCSIANDFTIVGYAGLYCDRQVDRNMIQAIIPIGSVLGLIIVNYISDTKGRRYSLIFVQIVGITGTVLTIIGGYISAVWMLVIAQLLCGFSGYSMFIMAYIVPSEYCQEEFRQKSIIIINYAWSATSALIGILFFYYNQWYNYLILFVLIPMVGVLLICMFFVVEGPNFLYGQKRDKQCLESLEIIALVNDRYSEFKVAAQNFKYQSAEQQKEEVQSFLSVLKDKQHRKLIIILILIEGGANLYYYGTNYALDEIGFDYGSNMIVTGIIEIFAFFLLSIYITKIPRKRGLFLFYFVMILFGMLFFIDPLKDNKIVAFVILGFIRFFATLGYTIVVMLLTESFPMSVQATCAGIIEAVAQFGSFLAPIVITFCINLQIYPIIVLSFIAIVFILIPLQLIKEKHPQADVLKDSLIEKDSLVDNAK